MAIYIQQSPEEVQHSFNLQRRAEITSVRLVRAAASSELNPESHSGEMLIEIAHKSAASGPSGSALFTEIDFTLTATRHQDPGVTVFTIMCAFRLQYELEEGYRPTPPEVEAFAGANAVFNAWPYFREFAQSAALRMGFAGIPTIPFLKLAPRRDSRAENPESGRIEASQPPLTRSPRRRSASTEDEDHVAKRRRRPPKSKPNS